jgi:streptogramin lyase
MRLDATTGEVRARVKLPASPVSEATVGVEGDTGYVLVDPAKPRVVVVAGERVADEIPAPTGAAAVRAGFGSLWVPTINNTVERYSLKTRKWTTIAVGPEPRFLDVGFAAVWVMNQGDGSITRIDARSGTTEALPITGVSIRGGDLTVGPDAVWLRTHRQVARIDPRTRTVTHLIDLPPGSASAAATEKLLVITNHDHEAVHLVPLPLPR